MDTQPNIIFIAVFLAIAAIFLVLLLNVLGIWIYIPAILFTGMTAVIFAVAKKGDDARVRKIDWLAWAVGAVASICAAVYIGVEDKPIGDLVAAQKPTIDTQLDTKNAAISAQRLKKTIRTNVDDILDTYEANQIGGLKKFGDANLKITGEVLRVREAMGVGIIILRSRESSRDLELSFASSATIKLAPLLPGDTIEATCTGVIEAMSVVVVGECSDVTVL